MFTGHLYIFFCAAHVQAFCSFLDGVSTSLLMDRTSLSILGKSLLLGTGAARYSLALWLVFSFLMGSTVEQSSSFKHNHIYQLFSFYA